VICLMIIDGQIVQRFSAVVKKVIITCDTS
jgi:hypothetical protein